MEVGQKLTPEQVKAFQMKKFEKSLVKNAEQILRRANKTHSKKKAIRKQKSKNRR
jgi:hypothetical protein